MIASGVIRGVLTLSGLALTPKQKWAAARGLSNPNGAGDTSDFWFFVLAITALIILVALLWHVSKRRRVPRRGLSRELFAENAMRRGLSPRERQILLAVVMRSGLVRSHDVFTTVDAFDRGAAKLLAECVRTRTVDEIDQLRIEVASLREKLGFQVASRASGPVPSRTASSRDIPVDSVLELTRRRDRNRTTIQARVVRNDDIELAVDLETPVESHTSDAWRVRYSFGMSVWEFDTSSAGGEGKRLMLNHSDHVRFVNRRRFPRVVVSAPALIAHFPFVRRAASEVSETQIESDRRGRTDGMALDAPAFVEGVVTELAGPGLRIEAPLEVRAGDRVIVACHLASMAGDGGAAPAWDESECIVESVAQVRHWRSTSQGASIAVEMIGLSELDIDTLVRITNQLAARVNAVGALQPAPAQTVGAAASGSILGQEA
ncbi:MAG: hypothetical protein JW993_03135 [Sedimentisphaerales bacterium]|nr:hypothetical protein [Sedimentisphaerales bacterium]